MNRRNPNFIVPVGTQIVSQIDILGSNGDVLFVKGVVGVVVRAPLDTTHAYRVRFMDGTEVTMKRAEFAIRRHFTNNPSTQKLVYPYHSLYSEVKVSKIK